MSSKRARIIGRKESGGFIAFPHRVLTCANFRSLSPKAVKLLVNLASQYRGKNNGDLAMPWELMRSFGWRSKDTLYKARDELIRYGFILLSRQGGKNRCSLYAITWWAVDECQRKLDIPATKTAPGNWKLCPEK